MPLRAFLTALVAAVALSACSGPPPANSDLDAAREAYEQAAADPAVTAAAADYLADASSNLATGEQLRLDKANPVLVTHYAFMARNQVAIAREAAALAAAEAEIASAESERAAVQLEVRTAEAEAARRRAETARREAEAAQAEAAEQRRQAEMQRREAEEERRRAEQANREAQQAQSEAQRAQREAEAARAEAAAALARAQELASRISELEANQTERGLVLTLGDVLFDTGRSELKPGSVRAIDQLAQFLSEYPNRNVLIEGFTDITGREETNQALSERRAAAVQAALVAKGVAPARIQTVGYGIRYPRASNDNAAGRQLNRRVEVVISDESGVIPARTQ